jgi:hypothetical protein
LRRRSPAKSLRDGTSPHFASCSRPRSSPPRRHPVHTQLDESLRISQNFHDLTLGGHPKLSELPTEPADCRFVNTGRAQNFTPTDDGTGRNLGQRLSSRERDERFITSPARIALADGSGPSPSALPITRRERLPPAFVYAIVLYKTSQLRPAGTAASLARQAYTSSCAVMPSTAPAGVIVGMNLDAGILVLSGAAHGNVPPPAPSAAREYSSPARADGGASVPGTDGNMSGSTGPGSATFMPGGGEANGASDGPVSAAVRVADSGTPAVWTPRSSATIGPQAASSARRISSALTPGGADLPGAGSAVSLPSWAPPARPATGASAGGGTSSSTSEGE